MSREFRILAVCMTQEEKRKEVYAETLDIYTRVLAISWFNLWDMILSIHILGFVGQRTQNSPACILHNHQPTHEWQALGWDLVLRVRTVSKAGLCFCIAYDFYRSDLVHFGANRVVLRLSQLCNHPTRLPMRLAVEKAHATDVIAWRICHCWICDAFSSAEGWFPMGSWRYTHSMVWSILPRTSAILW